MARLLQPLLQYALAVRNSVLWGVRSPADRLYYETDTRLSLQRSTYTGPRCWCSYSHRYRPSYTHSIVCCVYSLINPIAIMAVSAVGGRLLEYLFVGRGPLPQTARVRF